MSARGEHEAEGRAVEAHQEAKHAARPVTLTEAEAADVVDALDDAAELALHTGRSTAASEAEELRDVVRRRIGSGTEEHSYTFSREQHATLIAALALAAQEYANPSVVIETLDVIAPAAAATLREAREKAEAERG